MALDRVACAFKLGNKITAPGKEMLAPRHLMPVGYIAEHEWGQPLERIISRHCARCFAFVVYEQSDIPRLRQAQAPNSFYTQQKLDHTAVPRSILDNWDDPSIPHPLISKSQLLRDDHFVSSSTEPLALNNHKPDRNAVSAGQYTYGTGGDYATRALAYADIANLTADLTFTQISNTTENATATITETLNNHTLLDTCTPHFGSWLLGFTSTYNINDTERILIQAEGPGNLTLTNLKLYATAGINNWRLISADTTTTAYTLCLCHLLLDAQAYAIRHFRIADTDILAHIYSCATYGGAHAVFFAPDPTSILENCTFYNCSNTGVDCSDANSNIYNCASFNNTTDFRRIGGATGRNNASSDLTAANGNWNIGTNNLTGLNAATQFRSTTTSDSSLFLLPILNSDLYDNALAFTIGTHERYITRFLGHTPWAIGAKQVYPPFHHSSISQTGVWA